MADSGLVDAAVMEILAQDATLTGLCPDGVYWSVVPPRPAPALPATAFVIVAHFDSTERPGFGVPLYETTIYLVKAVIQNTSRSPARQAAARIQKLLQGVMLDLTDAGYTPMDLRRLERVAYPELDPANKAPWHHAGGQYALMHYYDTP